MFVNTDNEEANFVREPNWALDIDVWGIPHLVNNSLGGWLRPERDPVPCPTCQTHMYMNTHCTLSAQA